LSNEPNLPPEVEALSLSAEVSTSPCGSGEMYWRRWGDVGYERHIVLCHGGAGSWTHWARTLPALLGRCCVWAPDLPGLGDSAMPPALTPEGCAEPLAAGILQLVPASSSVQIVGFSWGAHVATVAASMLGTRVAGLTIVGCAAVGLPQPTLDFARETAAMTATQRDDVHRTNLHMLMISDVSKIDRAALDLQALNVRRARFNSRQFAPTDHLARALRSVTADITAIWGDNDQIALPTVEARLAVLREIYPALRSVIIEHSGHWVMYEQPQAFNEALLSLLGLPPFRVRACVEQ
jgi:pimeloyl-ACP methyl ester carboxylesterase